MAEKKLRIGVIGVALRGTLPLKYLPRDRASIVAGADINPEALENFRKNEPEAVFTTPDYRELLKRNDVDSVFIMVRDYLHEEMAIAALEAGKAVYLEKPMAISIAGCDRILETAFRTKSKLFLGHNLRYFPFAIKMKELLEQGVIGEIQSIWVRHFVAYGSCYFHHWCSERQNCCGLLLQKGAHDIDLIHHLAGGVTKTVVGMGKMSVYDKCPRRDPSLPPDREEFKTSWPPKSNVHISPVVDVEDQNMILMNLDNGVQASLLECFYTPDTERNYLVIGDRGKIEHVGHGGEEEIRIWTNRQTTRRSIPDQVIELRHDGRDHGGSDAAICASFVDFVLDGIEPKLTPLDARNAVAVGCLGHESMRGNFMPQTIPPTPPALTEYFLNHQK